METGLQDDRRDGASESNRDRVRRLLIAPCGFRAAKGTDAAEHLRWLDGLADELSYMTDPSLTVLAQILATKGQGGARNLWPDLATVRGYAEVVQRRPLEELPALKRWWASVEGPKAIADGTLVATWEWFQDRKAPPVTPQARKIVAERSSDYRRRVAVVRDKQKAGIIVGGEDLAWVRWFEGLEARLIDLVEQERAGKAVAA